MRIIELKFLGDIDHPISEIPVDIPIGSIVRGRRFKRGSALIEHHELEKSLRTGHPDSAKRLLNWLTDLELCYRNN